MFSIATLATLATALLAAAPPVMAGKRGLAWPWYNENSNLDPGKLTNSEVNWMYNWETWRPRNTNGLNFIGTQATMDSPSSPVNQLMARAQQQGWNTVFSLNEPDINGISPAAAADWYVRWINPLNMTIPSVTSSQDPGKGLDWTAAFLRACNGRCIFDYVNIHWYGHNFEQFRDHVQKAHNQFPNFKLVITEFALQKPANRDQQLGFLKSAMEFLDNADYVLMYSVFGASSPNLISSHMGGDEVGTGSSLYENDGGLTPNGVAYTNAHFSARIWNVFDGRIASSILRMVGWRMQ
ncbi:glycoside hydrolase family 128 protein [Ceratobasidium sp. AG-Ba]|nr:glycoside hydrolase family 128 protein [Ceratobasidium sp. AG-Ba]